MSKEAELLTKKLADEGKIIEAGWLGLRILSIPANAPNRQLIEMRKAYFAGAYHLWTCIMSLLEPGMEPTEADMRRLSLIHKELEQYVEDLFKKGTP